MQVSTRILTLATAGLLAGCAGGMGVDTAESDDPELGDDDGTTSGDGLTTISASAGASEPGAGSTSTTTTTARPFDTDAATSDDATDESSTGSTTAPMSESESSTASTQQGSSSGTSSTSGASQSTTGPGAQETVDLGEFVVEQTDSARSFVFEAGTILSAGESIVLVRDASRAAFEAHWGVTLAANVTYVNSGGELPIINGAETFSLHDAADQLVDGPSPPLELAGGARRSVNADGSVGAWTLVNAADIVPGAPLAVESGQAEAAPYLVRASDALGAGNFGYEFIELAVATPTL